jgi:hypothetical protein
MNNQDNDDTNESYSIFTDTDSFDNEIGYDSDLSIQSSIIININDDDYDTSLYENVLDEDDPMYREILYDDYLHLDSMKKHNHYYIGLCKYFPKQNCILYSDSVSPKTFLKYPYNTILSYLQQYSIIYIRRPKINIMKLQISEDKTYHVILKTHWLRIVQRHWKKVFNQRKEILLKRRSLQSLRLFEINARHSYGLNALPTIHGMLKEYNKKNI